MSNRSRAAVSVAFLSFGITVGGLIARMPALKDHLHLTDGQVGLALLGASLGGIVGSLASRLVIPRSARLSARLGVPILAVIAVGPGLAPNLVALIASLFVVGFLWAFIDVLDNALGAQLERTEGKHLINRLHGFWSLGAFLGSLVAGGAAFLGIAPVQQFVATGILAAIGSAWFLTSLPELEALPINRDVGRVADRIALSSLVLALAAISFTAVIAEGGTSDWSPLFLREISRASPGVAAAGFSGFTVAATVVRFQADRLTARTSRQTVVRIGSSIAVCGLILVIAIPLLPVAILGFALVGTGTAVVLPLTFAAGANLGRAGTSLALVMASTYAGTIAGPPLIGAAADHFGLRVAMGIPLLAALVVLVLAGILGYVSPARPHMKRITASMPR